VKKLNPGEFEIIYPSQTILAEPPVSVVDVYADKHGTREVAAAYLRYLYSPTGQDVVARNYYRPRDKDVLAKYAGQFPAIQLFTVAELFGGWGTIQKEFFGDGGIFDQIYKSSASAQ
jgi:ABC-type sulfate transport system substrate-binding protein